MRKINPIGGPYLTLWLHLQDHRQLRLSFPPPGPLLEDVPSFLPRLLILPLFFCFLKSSVATISFPLAFKHAQSSLFLRPSFPPCCYIHLGLLRSFSFPNTVMSLDRIVVHSPLDFLNSQSCLHPLQPGFSICHWVITASSKINMEITYTKVIRTLFVAELMEYCWSSLVCLFHSTWQVWMLCFFKASLPLDFVTSHVPGLSPTCWTANFPVSTSGLFFSAYARNLGVFLGSLLDLLFSVYKLSP